MDTKARIYINKYMRMFVCFCAALFLMLWTPRITAWADGGTWNGVNWSCDGSSLRVSGATIPTVGRSSYPWYQYVSKVTSIYVDVNGGIGDNAFYGCYNARTIDIGGNVSYIGSGAFAGTGGNSVNAGTTNVYMRYNGVMSFASGNYPFRYAGYRGTAVYYHVYPINYNAYSSKQILSGSAINDVYFDLPYSADQWYAWGGITWNFNGTVGQGQLTVKTRDGSDGNMWYGNKNTDYQWFALINLNKIHTIYVPTAANIGQYAFSGCNGVGTINVSVTGEIGASAFSNCSSASGIWVNGSRIGDNAFYGCYNARTIDIGGNVSYIGSGAFAGTGGNSVNAGTTNVYMRYNGVMSFASGNYPFRYAGYRGTAVYCHVYPINYNAYSSKQILSGSAINDVYFDLPYSADQWYAWGGITWNFNGTVGQGQLTVKTRDGSDGNMWYGNKNTDYQWFALINLNKIHTIYVPTAANIGQYAFSGCNGVGTINVSVTGEIGASAFSNCSSASGIWVNGSRIGDNAFYGCYNARTIDIGGNVSYIGSGAFAGTGGNSVNAGTTNVYMRYNGVMSFASGNYPFRYAGYRGTAVYYNLWRSNTKAYSSKQVLSGSAITDFRFFDDVGLAYGCTHPSGTGWLWSGSTHYYACNHCKAWIYSHDCWTAWHWVTDGTNHYRYCDNCGLTWDLGTHYDNDANGFCDACSRDIQIPKVTRGTYVKDNTGIWVYSYVQDNSGNVPYTRWWVWNTKDNNWRYFDYQYTVTGDFMVNGVQYNRRFRVNISEYGNSTGPYHVDCRAYDATGLCSDASIDNTTNFLRMCSDVYIDLTPPVLERVTYEADSTGYWVYSYATDNEGMGRVAYPSWTELNGQDDLQTDWSNTALGTAGSWTINGQIYNNRYRVDKSSHNNESGPYITHIYAYDASNNYAVTGLSNIYLKYLVTYIDISISDSENGKELGRTTKYADYNSNVAGADLGTDKTKGAYYENYQYEKCTAATVTDQGATVYRHFKLSTVTITFHDQGGSGGPGTVTWIIGEIKRPDSPTWQGYNFAGWTTNEDGTGTAWPASNEVPIGITDYYAQWVPNMYTTVQEQNTDKK